MHSNRMCTVHCSHLLGGVPAGGCLPARGCLPRVVSAQGVSAQGVSAQGGSACQASATTVADLKMTIQGGILIDFDSWKCLAFLFSLQERFLADTNYWFSHIHTLMQ